MLFRAELNVKAQPVNLSVRSNDNVMSHRSKVKVTGQMLKQKIMQGDFCYVQIRKTDVLYRRVKRNTKKA